MELPLPRYGYVSDHSRVSHRSPGTGLEAATVKAV